VLYLQYVRAVACVVLFFGAAGLGCTGKSGSKVSGGCPENKIGEGGVCEIRISVDSVGFLPARAKEATLVGVGSSFVLRRADGSAALSGEARGPVASDADQDGVYVADFSAFAEAGEYTIEAGSEGALVTSPRFRIGPDVYDEALRTLMLGMYGWRCGAAIQFDFAGQRFAHAPCHIRDAYRNYVDNESGIKPSLYGWHDAGDYGKYTTNGTFALGILLEAWEQFPESLRPLTVAFPEHGALPDYLAELKWELDWLLTTQFPDGGVSHKVTALAFEALNVPPEGDGSSRYFAPKGTAATADLAAVLAMAARIYGPYDSAFAASCLSAARLSYQYLQNHSDNERPDLGAFSTGPYQLDDGDPRLWAAAELWETTGDANALADAENRIRLSRGIPQSWDWGAPGNLGVFTYLLSQRDGRDSALVSRVTGNARASADAITSASEQHAYGRCIPRYSWGSNGSVARTAINLQVAYRLFGDLRYLDAAVRQIGHLFGRNVYARSQVTGIGNKPPLYPHHRPSVAFGTPYPGLLVGGTQPSPRSWNDSQEDFTTNEVAINWNAALIYALAGFTSATNHGTVGVGDEEMADGGDGSRALAVDAMAEGESETSAVDEGPLDRSDQSTPAEDGASEAAEPDDVAEGAPTTGAESD
jgi:endoglucanase